MREIKFRAFDIKKGKMLGMKGVDILFLKVKSLTLGNTLALEDRKFEEIELMQFTGLKDKNGKEIYEGDIVSFFQDRVGEIIYCGDCFSIDFNNDLDDLHFYQHQGIVEVIGNKFENPELL